MLINKDYLTVQLNQLVYLMTKKAEKILLENYNIDYSQFLILYYVDVIENPNQQIISKYMGFSGAGISKLIDKLENSRLIKKVIDINNRRSNLISLTVRGQKIISSALPLIENEFDSYINSEDKKKMTNIANKTIQAFKK